METKTIELTVEEASMIAELILIADGEGIGPDRYEVKPIQEKLNNVFGKENIIKLLPSHRRNWEVFQ